jgi:hypothetical protein
MELTRDFFPRHNVPAFPGQQTHSRAFAAWKEKVENYAVTFTEVSDPVYGVLWLVITPADWLLLPGVAGPFVRLAAPAGARPAGNLGAPWDRELEEFTREARAEALLRAAILSTCDELAEGVMKRGAPLRSITATMAMERLEAEWGTPRGSDMQQAMRECEQKYVPPASLERFFLTHTDAHALLIRANQPLSEFMKVACAVSALTPCGHFRECFVAYEQRYVENDPLRTFDTIRTAVLLFASRFPVSETTGSRGYVATAREAELERKLASMTQQVAALTRPQQPAPKDEVLYCWTHGVPFRKGSRHSSRDCKHPAVGHQAAATMNNKMGGKAV